MTADQERIQELESAIRDFLFEYEKIRWGYDGDCGSARLVSILEDVVLK